MRQLDTSVRLFRSHAMTSSTWDRHRGHDPAYDVVDIGFNYRLDEPRAALGLSRLPRLDENIAARRAIVRAYRERLAEVPGIELAFDDQAVERASHFAFPVLLADRDTRDRFRAELKATASRPPGIRRCTPSPSTGAMRPPTYCLQPRRSPTAIAHCR